MTKTPQGSSLTAVAPRRESFDPAREFAVRRAFRFNGQDLAPGSHFKKTQLTTRRLRQFYEQRFLAMLPADEPVAGTPAVSVTAKPDFETLPDPALREWLLSYGVVPRHGWDRIKLMERCSQEWERRFGGSGKPYGPVSSRPGVRARRQRREALLGS